jgi:pyruvate kinase
VADVANAVLDGSDALMLSEETAVGDHPVRAVEVMAAIAAETERAALPGPIRPGAAVEPPASDEEAIAQAACELAAQRRVDLIVTITGSGETARLAARHRPAPPIVAFTGDPATHRRLALVRGVVPLLLPEWSRDAAETLEVVRRAAHERGWRGARAVFAARDHLWTGIL